MKIFSKVILLASVVLLFSACNSEQNNIADTASRETLDGFFSKDEGAVYCGSMQIEGADPETFHILADGYAADEDHVYYRVMQLDGEEVCAQSPLDPDTFVVFGGGYVGDSTIIFNPLYGIVSDKSFSIDPASFEVLDAVYVKDANGVYFLSSQDGRFEIKGADVDSFEVTTDGYAKDKNYSYYLGKILESNDESTDQWKTYYNQELGFQMDYLDTWSLEDGGFTLGDYQSVKKSSILNFQTSLDPYGSYSDSPYEVAECLKQDVISVGFQYHEMSVFSKEEFLDELVADSLEAESTNSRPSWGGLISNDSVEYVQTRSGKEIMKVEFDLSEYKPWPKKALCIGELPPDVIYFVPYKEDWSEFLLISIFNEPDPSDPLVEQAILTLSW